MLLTLAAISLKKRLTLKRNEPGALQLTDLPRHAREVLNLHGLNVATELLAGADHVALDRLRESADRASCPCLVLVESVPLPFTEEDEAKGEAAVERMIKVLRAAHRLGCNSAAVSVLGEDTPTGFDNAVERMKQVLYSAERLEVNLLISSSPGITSTPERLTELIKKIGGFRIGTFPDFLSASKSPDPVQFLRRLTPYASALTATSVSFKTPTVAAPKKGTVKGGTTSVVAPATGGGGSGGAPVHEPYDLVEYVKTVASVGYQGTLAIDYRGEGDPEVGIRNTRVVLEGALGMGKEAVPE
jgi:sugar phosphate isomerase/epimerase